MRFLKFLIVSFLSVLVLLATPADVLCVGFSNRIETLNFLKVHGQRIKVGAAYEIDRNLASDLMGADRLKYDNLRMAPVEYRFGILDDLEFGVGTGYSSNSAPGYPDGSGMESLDLFTRFLLSPKLATSLRLRFPGEPYLQPYGTDRVQLKVNFPMVFSFGQGYVHSEFGYTFAGGDVKTPSGRTLGSWKSNMNFGVGYSWKARDGLGYSLEVVGNQARAETEPGTFEDHLELVFGTSLRMSRFSHLKPEVGVGLLEGSPDLTVGVDYSLRLPPEDEAAGEPEVESRFSKRSPVRGPAPGEDTDTSPEASKLKELKREARVAFERGDLKVAVEKYGKILELEPDNAVVLSNLGGLHYRLGNYTRSRDYYRRAVELSPDDVVARKYLGASYYQLGNWKRAREEFRKALDYAPGDEAVRKWLRHLNS